ncbi:MAG: hypothetical protein FWF06_06700, partial [Symbiobacteriaceae bacterium]|nr:hypothetical protein [Symbiobacteriaceae bacterium]
MKRKIKVLRKALGVTTSISMMMGVVPNNVFADDAVPAAEATLDVGVPEEEAEYGLVDDVTTAELDEAVQETAEVIQETAEDQEIQVREEADETATEQEVEESETNFDQEEKIAVETDALAAEEEENLDQITQLASDVSVTVIFDEVVIANIASVASPVASVSAVHGVPAELTLNEDGTITIPDNVLTGDSYTIYYEQDGIIYAAAISAEGRYEIPPDATILTPGEARATLEDQTIEDYTASGFTYFTEQGVYYFQSDATGAIVRIVVDEPSMYSLEGYSQIDNEAAALALMQDQAIDTYEVDHFTYLEEVGTFYAYHNVNGTIIKIDVAEPSLFNLSDYTMFTTAEEALLALQHQTLDDYEIKGYIFIDEAGTYYYHNEATGEVKRIIVSDPSLYELTGYTQLHSESEALAALASAAMSGYNTGGELTPLQIQWLAAADDRLPAEVITWLSASDLAPGVVNWLMSGEITPEVVDWLQAMSGQVTQVSEPSATSSRVRSLDSNEVAQEAEASGAFYLDAGTTYYYEVGGVVYKVEIDSSGWYIRPESALASNSDAYNTYIDTLREGEGGFYGEAEQVIYFIVDDVVFKAVLVNNGLYHLPEGAVPATEDAYNAYVDSVREIEGGFYAEIDDVYYYELDGVYYKVVCQESGLSHLPEGAVFAVAADYQSYLENVAQEEGAFNLETGRHYFLRDGEVFHFDVVDAGWYNLEGATEVDEEAYIAYQESLRAEDAEAVQLAAGSYYFAKDGVVFIFNVESSGWYNLEGANPSDPEAYRAYIESLAVEAGGSDLAAGIHYFIKDGVVFAFNVSSPGWYDLAGATEVEEEAYTSYIRSLRAADSEAVNLEVGTHYFVKDGVVFKFDVATADWYDLEGAMLSSAEAYQAYVESLAVDEGGIELDAGTYYFNDGERVFKFVVTEAGWYDLGGAGIVAEDEYTSYIEALRVADTASINLEAGTHYFDDGSKVFMFVVETDGWYNLQGATLVEEANYNEYIEGLAIARGGKELTAGTHYFARDGEVFIFEVTEGGWYNLAGAEEVQASDYTAYIEGLREADEGACNLTAGTHYFAKDGSVFVFEVAEDGWYNLDGATETTSEAYNSYVDGLAIANDGIELTAGTHYFTKDGQVFVFTVDSDGWYDLDGATPTDVTAYQAYLEGLRAADEAAVELAAGSYYFVKDGVVMQFEVATGGWYNLDGATQTTVEAYNSY